MKSLHIIQDSREQRPWSFPETVRVSVKALQAGDYALADDDAFSIERKSLDDFVGTVSSGWARFQREIARMKDFDARVIIIEGTYRECCFTWKGVSISPPIHNHPMVSPQFVAKQIAVLTMMRVSVIFADDADLAAGLALAVLKERHYAINAFTNGSELDRA